MQVWRFLICAIAFVTTATHPCAQTDPNAPTITWLTSTNEIWNPGSSIALEVEATDPNGSIRDITFFEIEPATNILATLTTPPYRFETAALTNTTTFIAIATDNDGLATTSAPIVIQIAGRYGDDFYRPTILRGQNPIAREDTRTATAQPNERAVSGGGPYHTVWWSWTPPVPGLYSVTTRDSSFDTTLGVFTGTNISALTSLGINDDDPQIAPFSTVKFLAYPATNYMIVVDGFQGATGIVNLKIALEEPLIAAPANDRFVNRIFLSGTNILTNASNAGATAEPGEPRHAGANATTSVWWQWTPPTNGVLRISTEGSDFDTTLAVYGTFMQNPPPFNIVSMAANDDALNGGRTSEVSIIIPGRTNIFIAVQGFAGTTGQISLRLEFSQIISNQPNDNFEMRLPLDGSEFRFDWANFGATAEIGEPAIVTPRRSSVWWKWRAPETAGAFLTVTRISGGTPVAAIFTGDIVDQLTPVPRSGPVKPGLYTFDAIAGTEYAIGVDTQLSPGIFNLALTQTSQFPDIELAATLSSDGQSAMLNVGEANGPVIIYASEDLITWEPFSTNNVQAGQTLLIPIRPERARFFQFRNETPQ